MKARASNLFIGTVTLAAIAVAFAGFLEFRKIHAERQLGPLRIVFEGSAAGLRKGGPVNFDGVQIGQVKSVKLDGPRKIVALALIDHRAPIRKDTAVGLEAQGLTGLMAISLIGGAPGAPPVPLDEGVPTLSADLSEAQSVRETLHNIDHVLVDNRQFIRDSVQGFENYTAMLAGEGDAIDGVMDKANTSFANFDRVMARIDNAVPDLTKGKSGALYQKVQSIRELADSLKKRSATYLEESRSTLQEVSDGANAMARKFGPARR